ncbi:MAG: allophanate hydrolase [Rhodospirillales bacterium]|nr:allophanate hydrolase [Rhodospirillales bacterium]MBO6788266.1 allophanate hydrolase [Rhodospirillales bacterium]
MSEISLSFQNLSQAYRSGALTPTAVVAALLQKTETRGDDGVWIHRLPADDIMARAAELEALPAGERAQLPLFGLPFSVKDCIDIAGLPTTSACPAYEYIADRTNFAVARAIDAGAILIGKTNMDQFATGVVGVRTPYGVARNPHNADYIPGGSSSGAAVSVSAGLCAFAFGTDTGGSGRVPASYNNIVGLKPTLGLFSRTDMVNASKHFDTITVYALTTDDALTVLQTCQAVDETDVYGRAAPPAAATKHVDNLRLLIPAKKDLEFFGNTEAEALYIEGIVTLKNMGHEIAEIDFGVFAETSNMMFEPPWLAERYAAVGTFIDAHPDAVDPVVREVIQSSKTATAADAFGAIYKLHENAHRIRAAFNDADLIVVPTVGTVYKVADVMADPIRTNATNGRYLNFVSMADLAAIAVPNGFVADGVPMGITFVGPAFSDAFLAAFAGTFHRARVATLGATGAPNTQPEHQPAA